MNVLQVKKGTRKVRFVLGMRNIICNDILLCGDVVGAQADPVVEHDSALEAAKGALDMVCCISWPRIY